MTIKKIGVLIGTVGLIFALVNGCGSSSTNYTDNNNTDSNGTEIVNENFTGSAFSFILENLAKGMLSETGSDVMGNFLALLGWGDSGNSDEKATLNDIDTKITAIGTEITHMEGMLSDIMKELKFLDYDIKNTLNWPKLAISHINYTSQYMQSLDINGTPGEGDRAKINTLATSILDINDGTGEKVTEIHDAITLGDGDSIGLIQNYISLLFSKMTYGDTDLENAYEGLEHFTSILLNHQVTGVNLMIEANKAKDDNKSAQQYLDCFVNNDSKITGCNMLYNEINNMDSPNSFIYNAVSLVLRNMPLYDPFLTAAGESTLKQAEFYRLMVTGTKDTEFGLRLFHISTMDRPVAPDHLYASKDGSTFHKCDASRHVVKGRPYDQWDGHSVDSNTAYRIVEYACGSVPIGAYFIYPIEARVPPLTHAEVANYDVNYTKTDDGNIAYGLGIMHDYISNRFFEDSDHWNQQKHADENVHIYGSANKWPIGIEIDFQNQFSDFYGSTELDGHFTYSGSEDKGITIDYRAEIYLKASAEEVYLGSKPWAKAGYKTGVWNSTNSDNECSYEYTLTAGSGHHYHEYRYPKHSCKFTAKPGHHYYVYFKMFNKGDETDDWDVTAISKLEKVYRVYVKFSE